MIKFLDAKRPDGTSRSAQKGFYIHTSGNFKTSLANFHSLGWSSSIVVSCAAFPNVSGLTLAVRAMDLKI